MRFLRLGAAAAGLAVLVAAAPAVSTPRATACALPAELSAARAAFGRATARELRATGSVTTSGLHGRGEIDEALLDGRNAQRFRIAAQGDSATVYDGATRWQQDVSGGVHPLDSNFARELARTDAWIARRAYLAPAAGDSLQCLGARRTDGRTLLVVRARPRAGQPVELAFEPQTHLLWSASERLATTTQVTRYGDYRQTGSLVLPYEVRSGTLSQPDNGFVLHVERYALLDRVRSADFARPRETEAMGMAGGARSTTVPLALEGRQLVVWASIDGHAPMPFILDSGGHAILTTGAAAALGLQAVGAGVSGGAGAGTIGVRYARVRSVRIGAAELRDQHFLVIAYPYSFYERGRRAPLAGILGLEFFERFAVHVDYRKPALTLTPLARFAPPAGTVASRIVFQEDTPLTHATVDGRAGDFEVDTGNAGTLILFGPFLARTGLDARDRSGTAVVGYGTGGSNAGRIVRVGRFSVAGLRLDGLRAYFTHMSSGTFSSWTEAGNFGYAVLLHYSPTFDYARSALYLDPHAPAPPILADRSGLGLSKNGPEAFDVVTVRPNSAAAAAGLQPGDAIVAVNGRPASEYSWADFTTLAAGAPGTQLRLRVRRNGQERDVALTLK